MIMFESIKKNSNFLKVYRQGKSYANKYLVMYVLETGMDKNRYGITVSKKVGNSVVRHRITRLIRESIRLNETNLEKGYDIVIVARNTAKDRKYLEIESAVLHLSKLHHIMVR
ncbi:MAG: ribonuclease P protein component [Lachnospiraceae bacterium]|nr:ribonuclease P protein component [Lachnospiraceae bacterium]